MKKVLLVLTILLTCLTNGGAENYPYRSDYLFVTVPDHDNWLYKTGEKAKISVEFYKYGIPRSGKLRYTIANDMLSPDASGSIEL